MTTGLTKGMSLEQAKTVVRDKAVELMGDKDVGIWTEVGNSSVLIGLARRGRAAVTIAVPRSEYDGMKLLDYINGIDSNG